MGKRRASVVIVLSLSQPFGLSVLNNGSLLTLTGE